MPCEQCVIIIANTSSTQWRDYGASFDPLDGWQPCSMRWLSEWSSSIGPNSVRTFDGMVFFAVSYIYIAKVVPVTYLENFQFPGC